MHRHGAETGVPDIGQGVHVNQRCQSVTSGMEGLKSNGAELRMAALDPLNSMTVIHADQGVVAEQARFVPGNPEGQSSAPEPPFRVIEARIDKAAAATLLYRQSMRSHRPVDH